jgi:hypothetical protein
LLCDLAKLFRHRYNEIIGEGLPPGHSGTV